VPQTVLIPDSCLLTAGLPRSTSSRAGQFDVAAGRQDLAIFAGAQGRLAKDELSVLDDDGHA
jgi:hypothetical protein